MNLKMFLPGIKQNIFSLFTSLLIIVCGNAFAQEILWDNPKTFAGRQDSRFPRVVSLGSESVVFWQEVDSSKGEIYLSCTYQNQSREWIVNSRFAGPFKFSGEVPDIYYPCANGNTICVSVSCNSNTVEIYKSVDKGGTFSIPQRIVSKNPMVSPRVFSSRNGSYLLFTSIAEDVSSIQGELEQTGYFQSRKYFMYFSSSADGVFWTDLQRFAPSDNLVNPFVPVLTRTDKFEVLAFRASKESPPSYKIYGCFRDLSSQSWSEPVLLSNSDALDLQDQSPNLIRYQNNVYMAWERTERSGRTGWKKSIMCCQIDRNGVLADSMKSVYAKGSPMGPVMFSFEDSLSVCFFDKSSETESTIYYAKFIDGIWDIPKKISDGNALDIFPLPVVSRSRKKVYNGSPFDFQYENKTSLSFVWQRNSGAAAENGAKPFLYLKEPDVSVASARLSFSASQMIKPGRHNKISNPLINVVLPDDVSKVDGFTYSWSQNEEDEPSVNEEDLVSSVTQRPYADAEGYWYFKTRTHDKAGNWSQSSVLKYYYDITPPLAVDFTMPPFDQYGFVSSNSTGISWKAAENDDDVAFYTYHYKIKKICDVSREMTTRKGHPFKATAEASGEYIESLLSKNQHLAKEKQYFSSVNKAQIRSRADWSNIDNGLYLVTVYAVDSVGNAGPQNSVFLVLNKYQPYTWIKSITTEELQNGDLSMNLYGKDFLYDGTVTSIFLDKDGKAPYDVEIKSSQSNYKVYTDRIENINIGSQLDEGTYYIGVRHSDRGIYFTSKAPLKIETNGTVKIDNDFEYVSDLELSSRNYKKRLDMGYVVLWLTIIVAFIGLIYFLFEIVMNIREISTIRSMVLEISSGEYMEYSVEQNMGTKRRGRLPRIGSLKFQLIGFTVSLVILIVVPIATRLGSTMIQNQKLILSQGLQDRIDFLLSSFYTGSTTYMPEKNGEYRLSSLRDQTNTVEGAQWVTITGFSKSDGKSDTLLYLWTTNDPSEQFQSSQNTVASSPMWISGFEFVNDEYEQLSESTAKLQSIQHLSFEIDRIGNQYGKPGVDDDENGQKEQQARINMENALLDLAKEHSGFMPMSSVMPSQASRSVLDSIQNFNFSQFAVQVSNSIDTWMLLTGGSSDNVNTKYLCYRPILYRAGSSSKYVRGIVFIQADTSSLIEEMRVVSREILVNVAVISVIAIVLGVIGAIILARLIVQPIKKVVLRARAISDSLREKGKENDVRKFEGKNLEIKRRDEIGELVLSINTMTKNLVQAKYDEEEALQNAKMYQDAAVVQGSLLPKERWLSNEKFEFFSYYLGADRVSGDYFDYKMLDDRWYVIIKSDASGHGTPAGLITVIVATLFRKYFEDWTFKTKGLKINELVAQINDFLNNLGLKGKFATIMLALYDTKTGDVYLCNAGDNIIHLFRSASRKVETLTLSNSPAAGQIDQFMIDMKGGYKIDKLNLAPGDVIFFYTDGVEENNRMLRRPDFSEYTPAEVKLMANLPDEVNLENVTEEMGPSRVISILEAALDKRIYKLSKVMNPVTGENLVFDFSKGEGSSKDAILGLASVEKVFRLYKPYSISSDSIVDVDKSIDEYLSKVFNLYDQYAIKTKSDLSQGATTFVQYKNVKQEVQADDLTLIAFRRLS